MQNMCKNPLLFVIVYLIVFSIGMALMITGFAISSNRCPQDYYICNHEICINKEIYYPLSYIFENVSVPENFIYLTCFEDNNKIFIVDQNDTLSLNYPVDLGTTIKFSGIGIISCTSMIAVLYLCYNQ